MGSCLSGRRYQHLGRHVALKVLPADVDQRALSHSNAFSEKPAQPHPWIIQTYAQFMNSISAQGQPFIVMQLLEGPNTPRLDHGQVRAQPPLQAIRARALDLAIQIANGLEAAQSKKESSTGISKPSNVFVTSRGEAKYPGTSDSPSCWGTIQARRRYRLNHRKPGCKATPIRRQWR